MCEYKMPLKNLAVYEEITILTSTIYDWDPKYLITHKFKKIYRKNDGPSWSSDMTSNYEDHYISSEDLKAIKSHKYNGKHTTGGKIKPAYYDHRDLDLLNKNLPDLKKTLKESRANFIEKRLMNNVE